MQGYYAACLVCVAATLQTPTSAIRSSSIDDRNSPSNLSDPAEQMIQGILSTLLTADDALANAADYPAHYDVEDGEQFDFIMVGAGSAGSVVANRLTERRDWTVLLLEAGGDPTKTTEVPALYPLLLRSDLDWQFQTNPDGGSCLGMVGTRCSYPAGKVLGGSSTINYMMYVRGNAKDFNKWEAAGNTGWGYKDVLPYFKKSEDLQANEVMGYPGFDRYHGKGGYLTVGSWRDQESGTNVSDVYAEGMKELGYSGNFDVNGEIQTGYATLQGTLREGLRLSTARAFLSPITHRENLKLSKHSLVSKVLIDSNKLVTGVEFINKEGKAVTVKAKKEVVLSAGTIRTPQLLMMSGIGPKEHLAELHIQTVEDLPVGENLQDHMLMMGVVISMNSSKSLFSLEEGMLNILLKKNSTLSGSPFQRVAFISTVNEFDYPDMQVYFVHFAKNDPGVQLGLTLSNFRQDIINQFVKINTKSDIVLVAASLLRPFSRGRIHINDTNPKNNPKITTGYYSDQRDIDQYQRLDDFVHRFVETDALKRVNAELHEINVPECQQFSPSLRDHKECTLRHMTTTNYHYCGTCKMGPTGARDAVVDPSLRVHGVDRLRVVDASVMPYVLSGNINAGVIMIGEKASDLIKDSWQ